MAGASASDLESSVLVCTVLVLLIVRRTYLQLHGARYSPGRLFGFAAFALLLFAGFAASTVYAALGSWGAIAWTLAAPYAVVAVVAAWWTEPHVRNVVRFDRGPDGQTTYRLPWLVPVLYVTLFTCRLGIEVAVFGLSSLASPSFPASLPAPILFTTIGFDLLYGVSVGLLFGRAFGVRRAFIDTSSTAPLPSS